MRREWCLIAALAPLSALVVGCAPTGPTPLAIDQLRSPRPWEGKRLRITAGRVERLYQDHVVVIDPGQGAERVDLICYFDPSHRAALEKALRGQEVTVTGRVAGPFDMWAFPTVRLEDCEIVLGDPPDPSQEPVLASRGRGQVDADRDIKAGKLRLRFRHGRGKFDPPAWFAKYRQLLAEQCRVEVDGKPEAGPIHGLHPDDREYNEVMTVEIEKRHGAGIVERLRKQAGG
jgi:hypothetical protein